MIPENTASHTGIVAEPVPPVDYDFKNGLKFNGIDEYIPNISNTTSIGTYTLSFWFTKDAFNSNVLFGTSAGTVWAIKIENSTTITVRHGTTKDFIVPSMTLGKWYNCVLTGENSLTKLYLNGVYIASSTLSSLWKLSQIGRRLTDDYWDGRADEIIYKEGYTAGLTEVQALYNGGDGADSGVIIPSANFYYKLDGEGTDRDIIDSSGSGTDELLSSTFPVSGMWVCHEDMEGEAALVVQRMTSPSGAFINGICEYVESEQLADGDNWDLTDEVQAFNVDSAANALTGWKQWDCFIDSGSPTFVTYKGYDFISANTDSLVMDFLFGVNSLYDIDDAFAGADFTSLAKGTTIDDNQRIIHEPTNRLSLQIKYSGEIQAYINKIGDAEYDVSILQKDSYFLMVALDSSPYGKYYKEGNLEDISTGARTLKPTGDFVYLGKNKSTNSQYLDGTIRLFTIGAGIGFDPVSNSAAVRRFADRMLIQKHIIAVNTVLSRYTDLTDREVFALGRLVARSEENGNWALMDEVFMLGLYSETNALIGMKLKTGTNNGATYISGSGFQSLSPSDGIVHTNFIPSVDAIQETLGNVLRGGIISIEDDSAIFRPAWTTTAPLKESFSFFGGDDSRGYTQNTEFASVSSVNFLNRAYWAVSKESGINTIIVFRRTINIATAPSTSSALTTTEITLLNRTDGVNPLEGTLKAWHTGAFLTPESRSYFYTDFNQCVNELEIGTADVVDWDIASKTYQWEHRELAADQLEELVTIINTNCDSTTTGRVLNIVGHLGITINSQTQIDDLTGNKGWTVTTV